MADIVYYDNYAVYPASANERIYTFQYFNHNLRTRRGDFVLGSFYYGHTFQNKSELSASFLYEYIIIDLVELGVVKYVGEHSLGLTSYFRNIENVINRVNTVHNDSILNSIYSNVGNSRAVGFELSADVKLSPWWNLFASGNLYHYNLDGHFDNRPVRTSNWVHSINANTRLLFPRHSACRPV